MNAAPLRSEHSGMPRSPSKTAKMARVQITTRALEDLGRFFRLLCAVQPEACPRAMLIVRRALDLLSDHPLPRRDAENGRLELILSHGEFGHVVNDRWVPSEDVVMILGSAPTGSGL
jgi:plasmid stabilization system protein ParE